MTVLDFKTPRPALSEDAMQYRSFFGRGENKYGIYPPNWAKRWGPAPLLGIVFADNEFLAEKLAFDKGISPCDTQAPVIRFMGPNKRT